MESVIKKSQDHIGYHLYQVFFKIANYLGLRDSRNFLPHDGLTSTGSRLIVEKFHKFSFSTSFLSATCEISNTIILSYKYQNYNYQADVYFHYGKSTVLIVLLSCHWLIEHNFTGLIKYCLCRPVDIGLRIFQD